MIGSTWARLRSIAVVDGLTPDQAARLANLSIAAAFSVGSERDLSASDLRTVTLGLARHPLATPQATAATWRVLHNALYETPLGQLTAGAADEWTEAFQSAGGRRKELGAFATPSVFARRLALDTLDGEWANRQSARILDPSCGAGALLIACLDVLAPEPGPERERAVMQLHGLELDATARELCCLLLWLSAGTRSSLDAISANVQVGNAVTRDWWTKVDPFDVLIMNPPWESLRHKGTTPDAERERSATIARLTTPFKGRAELPLLFTAQGRGDRNLAKAFMELAPHLLHETGRMGVLVPAAFASDNGMAELRRRYFDQFSLQRWTSFENRAKHFKIDSRYKFGVLVGTRSHEGTSHLQTRSFAVGPDETLAPHVSLSRTDLCRVGGPGAMILELSSARELKLLDGMLDRGIRFFDGGQIGKSSYRREVDLSLGRAKGQFEALGDRTARWAGDQIVIGTDRFVPVVEGRMVGRYDCFQKSWVSGKGRSAVWRANGDAALSECRPQFISVPAYHDENRVVMCDVTSSTNTRTMLATMVPKTWVCGNTAPTLVFDDQRSALAALAVLNSMVFDWMTRRIVAGLHLNKFYLDCLAWPALTDADVDEIARISESLSGPMLRKARSSPAQTADGSYRLESLAQVEALVARQYGLSKSDLEFMFDPDKSDRRGFWRHFKSDEAASRIASRAAALLDGATRPARRSGSDGNLVKSATSTLALTRRPQGPSPEVELSVPLHPSSFV